MHFSLVDRVLETGPDRIVTLKQVTAAEEYLQDHFPGYPILPGVFMLESMVQAARTLLDRPGGPRLVLGRVRNVKYGAMVRPGDALVVEITVRKRGDDGAVECNGTCRLRPAAVGTGTSPAEPADGGSAPDPATASASGETAASGRFTMRPVTASR
ncbi:MAG: 3-hydroxyacyl-[acyl-carrier-protein] dehydratase FabZ [Phycisphaerales bacterium]